MIKKRQYVEGLGEVGTSIGNLATNVQDLGARLISVRDDAYARIQTAGNEDIGRIEGTRIGRIEGTRVCMVVTHLKGDYPVLEKKRKFPLGLAKRLVEANFQGKYHSTSTSKAYDWVRKKADKEEQAGIDPAKRTAIVLPSRTSFVMSPDNNAEYYAFVFEDMADSDEQTGRQSYFQLNKGAINFYPIGVSIVDGEKPNLLTAQNGSIPNCVWLGSFGGRSNLGGDRVAGDCGDGSRGVCESAEGAS